MCLHFTAKTEKRKYLQKFFQSFKRSWNKTATQMNSEHKNSCGFPLQPQMKLLLGGQCDLSVGGSCPHVLSELCVIRGKAFTLSLLRCQSGSSMHAMVGGVGIHGEQGLAFACCSKTHYPAWCPPPSPKPLPIHPLSPLQNPPHPPSPVPLHPPSPLVLAAPLPAYQKYAMAEQWAFYPHETWNVSECCRPGPSRLSEHALCPLVPPSERRGQ